MLKKKTLVILCGCVFIFMCFVHTVLIRREWLNRPLGSNEHEWLTAHSACVINNWIKEGALNLRFMHVLNPASIEFDTLLNRNPYVSYPTGALIPVFFLLKLLPQIDTILMCQFYNLATHFFIAIVLFLLMVMILEYHREMKKQFIFFLLIPSLIYLYSPPILFWHQNIFFADQAVMILFALFIYFEMKKFLYGTLDLPSKIFFITTVLLGIFTDWLFIFIIFITLILRIFYDDRPRTMKNAITKTADLTIPSITALSLFLYQIIPLGLFGNFISAFNRRHLRGPDGEAVNFFVQHIEGHIINGYGVILFFFTVVSFLLLLNAYNNVLIKKTLETKNAKILKTFVRLNLLLMLPCLMQIYIFQQHAVVHTFSALKWALPMAVIPFCVLPIAFIQLMRFHPRRILVFHLFVVFYIILLSCVFLRASQRHQMFFRGWNESHKEIGEMVRRNTRYTDMCFSPDFEIRDFPPYRLAYSGKRVYLIKNIAEIKKRLKKFSKKGAQGKLFINRLTGKEKNKDFEKICAAGYYDSNYYICNIDQDLLRLHTLHMKADQE